MIIIVLELARCSSWLFRVRCRRFPRSQRHRRAGVYMVRKRRRADGPAGRQPETTQYWLRTHWCPRPHPHIHTEKTTHTERIWWAYNRTIYNIIMVYYVRSIQSDTDQYFRALALWFRWTGGGENVLYHVEKRKQNNNINNKVIAVFRNIFICIIILLLFSFEWENN